MKLACQINNYKGDGSPLETEYRFCELQLDTEKKDKCSISFIDKTYNYQPKIYFTLDFYKICDTGMVVVGTNNAGYGKINLVLGTYGDAVYDLACITREYDRLFCIFEDSNGYFRKTYMPDVAENYEIAPKDIKELARKNFDANRDEFRKRNI
jgi:hypothetical protein